MSQAYAQLMIIKVWTSNW